MKIADFTFIYSKKKIIILFIIVLIGGFMRLYRLGDLPIDGDNSYHALAATAILKTGLPIMPNGDLYLRSLSLNYMEALSLKIFGVSEWSLRFPNALIGTLNIFIVYFLVMTLFKEWNIAIFTALLFSISPWAVTVARMPRMYEPLLMAVMLIWILFYQWYYLQRKNLLISLLITITSFFAISLHQIAIIPLSCFLTPLLLGRKFKKNNIQSAAIFIGFFAVWYGYKKYLVQIVLFISGYSV
jgi:4-amino-4-deoxy-L-arabinose transferase-like glycosyltransferase